MRVDRDEGPRDAGPQICRDEREKEQEDEQAEKAADEHERCGQQAFEEALEPRQERPGVSREIRYPRNPREDPARSEEQEEDGNRRPRDDRRGERERREDQAGIRDERREPAPERLGRRARGRGSSPQTLTARHAR